MAWRVYCTAKVFLRGAEGLARKLDGLVNKPSELKQALLDSWDAAAELSDGMVGEHESNSAAAGRKS